MFRFELCAPFAVAPASLDSFDARAIVRYSITRDEAICSWSETRPLYRSRTYVQRIGQRRRRLAVRDGDLVVVIGPFDR
jgi:hypothetical protein